MSSLEDRNLTAIEPLPAPAQLKTAHPISTNAARTVLRARTAIRDAMHGRDAKRLVAIVGPCSLHDPNAAIDYAKRLLPLAKELEDELVVVMRTYFEKPRTTVGWKGLVNDPRLDGSCRVEEGLALAREILLQVNDLGLPCATEFLDPFAPQFLADAITWAAIGARTTESQTHREMASGLSMPVGFKNGTDGTHQVAIDAMTASSAPHSFLGVRSDGTAAVVKTAGNPDTHVVLRGGGGRTNYDRESVTAVAEKLGKRGVMVDCSHGNSKKDPALQGEALRDVARQVMAGSNDVLGVMLESHLEEGRQDWAPGRELRYGVSITDACIGFEETDGLLRELAASVRSRRGARVGRRVTDAA
ncbi:MAG: 3-deoxy-7-phosphoheptulonate synthase [Myxococcota bacterium]